MKLTIFKPTFFTSSKHKKHNPSSPPSPSRRSTTSTDCSVGRATPNSVLPDAVTRRDLESLLRRLSLSEDELLSMLAEAVGSESCGIAVTDLAALGGLRTPEGWELRETFAVFDEDGDGRISAEELMGMLAEIGDGCCLEDCRRMIGEVGRDGFVGFEDFVRMMESQIVARNDLMWRIL